MDFKQARIVFMGTPQLAASLLDTLLRQGFNIVAVIAQPDAPVGRRSSVIPVASKVIASAYQVPVYQPESIRQNHEFINDIPCDLLLTLAYGQIVPDEVLSWPRLGALNVHGSLLPKLRGAAPIQYALMQGLPQTGITLMRMVTRMDEGEMFAKIVVPVTADDNYYALKQRMSDVINQHIPALIKEYLLGNLIGVPQNESEATYAPSIKKEQEHLDIRLSCSVFTNYIRALAPEPGAYLVDENNVRIKIFKTHFYDNHTDWDIGAVLVENKTLLLQLHDGRLAIDSLQLPGKRIMTGSEFLAGHQKIAGAIWK